MQGIVERAQKLQMGNGFADGTDIGPVISPAARERIEGLIGSCEAQGGRILLDGRGAKVDGYPNGNWVGPTILEATTEMDCYTQEIFGPCLTIVKAKTLDDAIKLINRNQYGNGAAIFTQSGATARKFERTIEAGQIGINVPIVGGGTRRQTKDPRLPADKPLCIASSPSIISFSSPSPFLCCE